MRTPKTPNFASAGDAPRHADFSPRAICTRLAIVCTRFLSRAVENCPGGWLGTRRHPFSANDSARGAEPAGIIASNDLTVGLSGDGTGEFFLPFGEHPVTAKDPVTGKTFPAVQVINAATAGNLLAAMNTIRGRIARALGQIPVYVGHPDVPGRQDIDRDRSSYGVVTAANIATREVGGVSKEGIAFSVRFNRRGRELMADEPPAYMYHSPHWPLDRIGAANGRALVAPIGIYSFGLTNSPNIEVPMIAMNEADMGAEPPAVVPPPPPPPPSLLARLVALIPGGEELKTDDDVIGWAARAIEALKKVATAADARWKAEDAARLAVANEAPVEDRLIALLAGETSALAAANDRAAAAEAALADERASRARAETNLADAQIRIAAANDSLQAARAERSTAIAAAAGLLIDAAVTSGRLVEGDRARQLAAFNERPFEDVAAELAARRPVVPVGSLTDRLAGRRGERNARLAFLTAVNERAAAIGGPNWSPAQYEQAWAQVKASHAHLYQEMGAA